MFLYRQLTTLDTTRCASLTLDAMRVRPVNRQEAATLLREFELSSLERELATLIRDGRVAVEHDTPETVDSGKGGPMRQLSLLDTPKAEPRQLSATPPIPSSTRWKATPWRCSAGTANSPSPSGIRKSSIPA